MLKNYIKIAFRNLFKQKVYSFINIFGLAVGLACFILILLFVQHELSYDRFHENWDRIHRVVQQQPGNVSLGTDYFAVTPAILASTLLWEYPEIKSATALQNREAFLRLDEQSLWENGLLADEHFFDVFSFPLLSGDVTTALAEPNSIVLTQTLARKLFGDEPSVGRTLRYQLEAGIWMSWEEDVYTVTGIVADIPANSSIQFSFIVSAGSSDNYLFDMGENAWSNSAWYTFFVLADGNDDTQFQAKMPALVEKYLGKDAGPRYIVQALSDVHLRSRYNADFPGQGNITNIYLFLTIAFLILLLACVNYMNLAVARSIKRAREVGLRKVVGAQRGQLILQFLGESVLMTFLAFILALVMVDLLLPFFGHLVERPIRMDYLSNGLLLPGLLVLVILVGLLSGSYPAFFMASLRPMQALTGKKDSRAGRFRVQRMLIVGQYSVSIALAVGSFVVYQQMQYVQNKELGYDREHVVTIQARDMALRENYVVIRDELLRNPNVMAVTSSNHLPTHISSSTWMLNWEGHSDDEGFPIYHTQVGHEFMEVFGIQLVAGRAFSPDMTTDPNEAYLINETAARALGWTPDEAVGKYVFHNGQKTIIGVVKDFHMHSMHLTIQPMMLYLDTDRFMYISVKLRPDNLPETIAFLERVVKQFTPYPFEYQFLDDRFDQLYKRELRLGETFGFFTILALLIASLGLFGLAAYAAEQRTKEIGVRKVLGATVANIVTLLSKDFLKLVLIGFVIAIPIAWYAMNRWLEDFAYRIEIGPGVFLLAGLAAVLIALATVSWQSVRAAVANPVESLRSE